MSTREEEETDSSAQATGEQSSSGDPPTTSNTKGTEGTSSGLLGGFLGRKKPTTPPSTRASSIRSGSTYSARSRRVLQQVSGTGREFFVKRLHLTKGGKAVSDLSDDILSKTNVE